MKTLLHHSPDKENKQEKSLVWDGEREASRYLLPYLRSYGRKKCITDNRTQG